MKPFAVLALTVTLAVGTPPAFAEGQLCTEATPDDAPSAASSQRADQTVPNDSSEGTRDASASPQRVDQVIYKGVVGNLLEAVPLDPVKRVELQRTNAVISNPLSARSIALLLGITNPVVMIGGLVWGLWAASRIEAPAPESADRADVAVERAASAGDAAN